MDFEWDEKKRQSVWSDHGVDFEVVADIFYAPLVTVVDDRYDYGEVRYRSVGVVGDECYLVVHTRRENRIRLITAWKVGEDDRREYDARIKQRASGEEGSGEAEDQS